MRHYDVVIVGGGPAGLSAALSLGHFRRSVLLLDAAQQRNRDASAVHNYLGFEGVSPLEFLKKAREEVSQSGAEIIEGRAVAVRPEGAIFLIALQSGETLRADRILFATGLVDITPDVENLEQFYGKTVVHCPICDAATFADRPIVVISWGANARAFALELKNWTNDLTVVTHGHDIPERDRRQLVHHGIEVLQRRAQKVIGEAGRLEALVMEGGQLLQCEAIFFNVGHVPRVDLPKSLGCLLSDEGYVKVDEKQETTVAGVYAAGDITPREQSVITAAAEGLVAANNIHLSLYDQA